MNIKDEIKLIFKNNNLIFNKDFENNFSSLKNDMQTSVITFCKDIILGKIPHIPIISKKYKDHILFIDKIADKRIIVVKIKNSDYIEIHLSNHDYYDEQRERFGIKKEANIIKIENKRNNKKRFFLISVLIGFIWSLNFDAYIISLFF